MTVPVFRDRVEEGTASTGTGSITLTGAATGANTFNSVVPSGSTVEFGIDDGVGNWEIARGTSVVDAGSGDLNGRWSVANAWETHTVKFAVSSGAFWCRVYGSGSLFFVR